MTNINKYLIIFAYIFLIFISSFYLYEQIASLLAVLNYEVGENIVYLYYGNEKLLVFRLLVNVMPLGTSVEVDFLTIVKGLVYLLQSLGIVEILFLLFIIFLVFFNFYIEEDQKDIVYIHNALMGLLSIFLCQILIYIIIFLLSVIFLKILYKTAFLIITIVLILGILLHLFILIKSLIKFIKFLKFR